MLLQPQPANFQSHPQNLTKSYSTQLESINPKKGASQQTRVYKEYTKEAWHKQKAAKELTTKRITEYTLKG